MKALLLSTLLVFSLNTKAEDKKIYTQEEFDKALDAAIEKKMKRIGRGKLVEFSQELLKKEQNLEQREKALKNQQNQIAVNQKELEGRIQEFKKYQTNFLSCLDKKDSDESKRVIHMVDVVSNMRPQTAADLLSQQDPSISIKILGELDPVKVSKIFNMMDKEISARLQKQYMTMKK
ncbi:MotE family protein [Halobacteriovorax sp. DPLXC-1]|uniref:MotE family protein n=1 Tax=Halobacteriovorax sp. DPLXC-1 TaxID=3110771 RepID=UPI002FF0D200